MTIQEILGEHDADWHQDDWWVCCKCGFEAPIIGGTGSEDARDSYRAHVAEVLDKHIQELEAKAWDRLVDYAPFTAFERVRLRCENPFREEPNDG